MMRNGAARLRPLAASATRAAVLEYQRPLQRYRLVTLHRRTRWIASHMTMITMGAQNASYVTGEQRAGRETTDRPGRLRRVERLMRGLRLRTPDHPTSIAVTGSPGSSNRSHRATDLTRSGRVPPPPPHRGPYRLDACPPLAAAASRSRRNAGAGVIRGRSQSEPSREHKPVLGGLWRWPYTAVNAGANLAHNPTAGSVAHAGAGYGYGSTPGPRAPARTIHARRSCPAQATATPTCAAVVRVDAPGDGFDWGDASIGAGGALALMTLGIGGALGANNIRRRTTRTPA